MALIEPDAQVHHRGQLVLAGPSDPLGYLASTGMTSASRPGPSPGSGIVGRRPDRPPFGELDLWPARREFEPPTY